MFKTLRRWWKYIGAKLNMSLSERADPKVQLEQAIMEAQEQHRRLREQAANVIANQKQTEMRLNRAMEELEKVNSNARQAVLMADEYHGSRLRVDEAFGRRHIGCEARQRILDRDDVVAALLQAIDDA